MTGRIGELSSRLPEDMDAALVTSAINRRYFLGFPSSAGTLLVTRDKSVLIIDSRYFEAAGEAVVDCEIILQDKLYQQLAAMIGELGVKALGVESETTTLSAFARLEEKLPDTRLLSDGRLSGLIWDMRGIKSADEIDCIAAAQAIAEKTFDYMLGFIRPGVTELQIAVEMEQFARRSGSEEPAFSYIVAAGKNSSRPHAVPSDNIIKAGDFVVLDFGATKGGYRSDMTRTVAVGHVSDLQRRVYEIVLKAQLAAIEAIKPGAQCAAVDGVARKIIEDAGFGEYFGHGLGHSLGLEIHEPPRLSKESKATLRQGVVTSVEPGIYLPGQFGVRIEDIAAVTGDGCRNLTNADKNLIIL